MPDISSFNIVSKKESSGQKRFTKINFCAAILNIFLKEIVSNNTKCRKLILNFVETVESIGEMELVMKYFISVFTNSLNFKISPSFWYQVFFR